MLCIWVSHLFAVLIDIHISAQQIGFYPLIRRKKTNSHTSAMADAFAHRGQDIHDIFRIFSEVFQGPGSILIQESIGSIPIRFSAG